MTRRPASGWCRRLPNSTCRRSQFGQSAAASLGERVVVGGAGGRQHSVAARIVAKQEFAGYWEYVLDEAIFTAPAHPNWGGTALIGPAGDLLGIGSLQLQHAAEKGAAQNINMMVPIDLLKPIFDDLLKFGRRNAPSRPWLGFYATEVENRLVIVGLADRGPAKRADLRTGDIVLSVAGKEVHDLAEHVPPHLGARPSRRRSADHDLSRRRNHGSACEVERARSLPQGPELALNETRLKQRAQTFAIGRIAARLTPSSRLSLSLRTRRHSCQKLKAIGDIDGAASSKGISGGGSRPRSCAANTIGSPGGLGSSSVTLKMPLALRANAASIACAMSAT